MLLLLLFKLVISVILFLLSFELLEDVVESFLLLLFITDVDAVVESVLENELFDSVVDLKFHGKKIYGLEFFSTRAGKKILKSPG